MKTWHWVTLGFAALFVTDAFFLGLGIKNLNPLFYAGVGQYQRRG